MKLAARDANCAHAQQIKSIDPQQDGKYNGPVEGQEAKKPNPGTRDLGDPVETFAKPLVVIHSAASTALTTDASIAAFAGQDQSYVAQNDTHLTAAHTAAAASGETTSLFTQSGGIQAIAANGPVSIRAHTDALEIKADQSIKVTSSNDSIRVQANQKIELLAGQSSVVLEGANITFTCPGAFTVKAAQHAWAGGGGNAASLPNLPSGSVHLSGAPPDTAPSAAAGSWASGGAVSPPPPSLLAKEAPTRRDHFRFRYAYHDGEPVAGAEYVARLADGSVRKGRLDAAGFVGFDAIPPGHVDITVGADPRAYCAFKLPARPDDDAAEWMRG
jgi:type VI secretion system secreted protein VgrG